MHDSVSPRAKSVVSVLLLDVLVARPRVLTQQRGHPLLDTRSSAGGKRDTERTRPLVRGWGTYVARRV
jgi:hypothetical protein